MDSPGADLERFTATTADTFGTWQTTELTSNSTTKVLFEALVREGRVYQAKAAYVYPREYRNAEGQAASPQGKQRPPMLDLKLGDVVVVVPYADRDMNREAWWYVEKVGRVTPQDHRHQRSTHLLSDSASTPGRDGWPDGETESSSLDDPSRQQSGFVPANHLVPYQLKDYFGNIPPKHLPMPIEGDQSLRTQDQSVLISPIRSQTQSQPGVGSPTQSAQHPTQSMSYTMRRQGSSASHHDRGPYMNRLVFTAVSALPAVDSHALDALLNSSSSQKQSTHLPFDALTDDEDHPGPSSMTGPPKATIQRPRSTSDLLETCFERSTPHVNQPQGLPLEANTFEAKSVTRRGSRNTLSPLRPHSNAGTVTQVTPDATVAIQLPTSTQDSRNGVDPSSTQPESPPAKETSAILDAVPETNQDLSPSPILENGSNESVVHALLSPPLHKYSSITPSEEGQTARLWYDKLKIQAPPPLPPCIASILEDRRSSTQSYPSGTSQQSNMRAVKFLEGDMYSSKRANAPTSSSSMERLRLLMRARRSETSYDSCVKLDPTEVRKFPSRTQASNRGVTEEKGLTESQLGQLNMTHSTPGQLYLLSSSDQAPVPIPKPVKSRGLSSSSQTTSSKKQSRNIAKEPTPSSTQSGSLSTEGHTATSSAHVKGLLKLAHVLDPKSEVVLRPITPVKLSLSKQR